VWPCIVTNFFIRPTRCTNFANLFLEWNSTCFRQCLSPSSGVHSLYTQQWYMSYRFVESLRAESGRNSAKFVIPYCCVCFVKFLFGVSILICFFGRLALTNFTFKWPCIVTHFFILRPTRCTNFGNLFLAWNSTCFREFVCPSSGVYSLYTQQLYISYKYVDSFRAVAYTPARKLPTNLCDIYHCWVYSEWTPEDGQRNCPKHVDFHAKNKFAKFVHLVGLIKKKDVNIVMSRLMTNNIL
jgi:hypothetical protein